MAPNFVVVAMALALGVATSVAAGAGDAGHATSIEPRLLGALAVSRDGTLYVVDAGRDQILRRLSDGQFRVVAGTGRRGFSGDGGRASRARIAVDELSGLAVGANGTVYFSDTGNGRVRAVAPDGVISSVAGGGSTSPGISSLPASRVRFAGLDQLNGLAVARGQLYIGAGGVYRLANGVLHWVVGSTSPAMNAGFRVYGANPAYQRDFVPAYTLALDGRGDLLVGGGNTWSLYERTASGRLRFVQGDRAQGGYYAAEAAAPGGTVVLAGGARGLARWYPSGRITAIASSALATVLARPNYFTVGDGVAVAPNGAIYLDAVANNGFSNVSAIVQLSPSGRVTLLWHS